jgi:uncharacterized protein YaaQ
MVDSDWERSCANDHQMKHAQMRWGKEEEEEGRLTVNVVVASPVVVVVEVVCWRLEEK